MKSCYYVYYNLPALSEHVPSSLTLPGIPPDYYLFYHPVILLGISNPNQSIFQILCPAEKHHDHNLT